jgi:hypothetical protein
MRPARGPNRASLLRCHKPPGYRPYPLDASECDVFDSGCMQDAGIDVISQAIEANNWCSHTSLPLPRPRSASRSARSSSLGNAFLIRDGAAKMPIGEISPFDRSPFVTSDRTSLTFAGGFATCRPRNKKDESHFVFLSHPSDGALLEWRCRPRHRVGMDLSTRLLPRGQRTR